MHMNMELSGRRKPTPDKSRRAPEDEQDSEPSVGIGLNAAIVAVSDNEPVALVVRGEPDSIVQPTSCRTGPSIRASTGRSKAASVVGPRSDWASTLAMLNNSIHSLTRGGRLNLAMPHRISFRSVISPLLRPSAHHGLTDGIWPQLVPVFPWEDWRRGRPEIITRDIEPRLKSWADKTAATTASQTTIARADRARICFGSTALPGRKKRCLSGSNCSMKRALADEAARDGRSGAREWTDRPKLGLPMQADHRRTPGDRHQQDPRQDQIPAGRVRTHGRMISRCMNCRETVEAILRAASPQAKLPPARRRRGPRRATGDVKTRTGGRPAKLFRFRREVLLERPAPGVRVSAPPSPELIGLLFHIRGGTPALEIRSQFYYFNSCSGVLEMSIPE